MAASPSSFSSQVSCCSWKKRVCSGHNLRSVKKARYEKGKGEASLGGDPCFSRLRETECYICKGCVVVHSLQPGALTKLSDFFSENGDTEKKTQVSFVKRSRIVVRTKRSPGSPLMCLDENVIQYIFHFLDIKSLIRACCTNKFLSGFVMKDQLWSKFYIGEAPHVMVLREVWPKNPYYHRALQIHMMKRLPKPACVKRQRRRRRPLRTSNSVTTSAPTVTIVRTAPRRRSRGRRVPRVPRTRPLRDPIHSVALSIETQRRRAESLSNFLSAQMAEFEVSTDGRI